MLRLLKLHHILADNPRPDLVELADRLAISRRTLFRDLALLRDAQLDPRTDNSAAIATFPLTHNERQALLHLMHCQTEQNTELLSHDAKEALIKVLRAS